MTKAVTFYFDFLSPYAYIAWTQIHALAARHGAEVVPRPTLLAALLADGATRGPAEIPKKRVYVFKDTFRTAKILGLPFGLPRSHPWNPLLALRIAGLPRSPAVQRATIDALFAGSWGGGLVALDDEAEVRQCLDAAGLDGAACVEEAKGAPAKERLRASTEDALANGVFGVPTACFGGEPFWGYDAFAHLELALRGEDPAAGVDMSGWDGLAASAGRRGIAAR